MPFLSSLKSAVSSKTRTRKQLSVEAPSPENDFPLLLSLKPVTFPKVLSSHQHSLADQGWTTVTYNPPDPLQIRSQELFKASKAFFELPTSRKLAFQTQQGTEDGWSRVEGEKEFITLRSLDSTPEELKDAAIKFWAEAGGLLINILGRIAESLDLPAEALTAYSKPCAQLGHNKTATMLRLFRYEGFEGKEAKTVAEAHRDLGLLSLVIGDTPGLEVWDRHSKAWFPIERWYKSPAASLLAGRQLERLSNGRYGSGGHLVRSYPDSPQLTQNSAPNSRYRYSLVFVLRAHSPVPVDTNKLETRITGQFQNPLTNITAGKLFTDIQRAHFNINTHLQEREEQRRNLAAKKNAVHDVQ